MAGSHLRYVGYDYPYDCHHRLSVRLAYRESEGLVQKAGDGYSYTGSVKGADVRACTKL